MTTVVVVEAGGAIGSATVVRLMVVVVVVGGGAVTILSVVHPTRAIATPIMRKIWNMRSHNAFGTAFQGEFGRSAVFAPPRDVARSHVWQSSPE